MMDIQRKSGGWISLNPAHVIGVENVMGGEHCVIFVHGMQPIQSEFKFDYVKKLWRETMVAYVRGA